MNIQLAFIAMFRAIDCLNDENSDPEMEAYIADADPYIFKDRRSAIPDIQIDFENSRSMKDFCDFNDYDKLYDRIYEYLKECTVFSERFKDISKDEWRNLCELVIREET